MHANGCLLSSWLVAALKAGLEGAKELDQFEFIGTTVVDVALKTYKYSFVGSCTGQVEHVRAFQEQGNRGRGGAASGISSNSSTKHPTDATWAAARRPRSLGNVLLIHSSRNECGRHIIAMSERCYKRCDGSAIAKHV